MMLYYIPSPIDAFQTTQYIVQTVYFGRFLETVHLYTAYAMIMLAFMHMMRDYFVSVHKKPRELMWVVGMFMGFVTLGFGFTGYLLPWTVVSKSATDVGIGMIDALPQPLSSFISFLVVGAGGDPVELLRFYDLHVVVLPAVLLTLLVAKMYMLEVHGISEPSGGPSPKEKTRPIPIFPDVTMYLLELAALFGAGMLLISVVFPLQLPPQYSPALAAQFTAQPDWYFLWIYQILKISIFEGPGLSVALTIVTLIFLVLVILPFIDRSEKRDLAERPFFVTAGIIFIAEIIVLAAWGYVTPGEIISVNQAVQTLGGTALLISVALYVHFKRPGKRESAPNGAQSGHNRLPLSRGVTFAFLAALGSLAIGNSLNGAVELAMSGFGITVIRYFLSSLAGLVLVVLTSAFLIYSFELTSGSLRRHARVFEIGRMNNGSD
jgi:quinol-cytochrome oxidoreductase complex cytochrome b subunit